MKARKNYDPWILEPQGTPTWPTVRAGTFGPATDAVEALIAQAATVTGPVHAVLCAGCRYDWAEDEWMEPDRLLSVAGRRNAFWDVRAACLAACLAAGWWGGAVTPDRTSAPFTLLDWALAATAVADRMPAQQLVKFRGPWDDAMPPQNLPSEAVPVWCRLRIDGVGREHATVVVRAATF